MNNKTGFKLSLLVVGCIFVLFTTTTSCKNENKIPPPPKDAENVGDYEVFLLEDTSSNLSPMPVTRHYRFKGKIDDKYEFVMSFAVSEPFYTLEGSYRYAGKKDGMSLNGKLYNNLLDLTETYYNEKENAYIKSGSLKGKFEAAKGTISGIWTSADSTKQLPFSMTNYYEVSYPQHNFKSNISEEESNFRVDELYVYDKKGNLLQTILDFDAQPTYRGVILEDINFDGYPDLSIMEFPEARNATYIYWLYNPERKIYQQTDIMFGLSNVSFDHENKTFTFGWTYGSDYFGHDTYKYQDGRYHLVEEYHYMEDEDGTPIKDDTVRYEIVGGESVPLSNETDKE